MSVNARGWLGPRSSRGAHAAINLVASVNLSGPSRARDHTEATRWEWNSSGSAKIYSDRVARSPTGSLGNSIELIWTGIAQAPKSGRLRRHAIPPISSPDRPRSPPSGPGKQLNRSSREPKRGRSELNRVAASAICALSDFLRVPAGRATVVGYGCALTRGARRGPLGRCPLRATPKLGGGLGPCFGRPGASAHCARPSPQRQTRVLPAPAERRNATVEPFKDDGRALTA